MSLAKSADEDGFVLVTTIWVLAVLTLLVAWLDESTTKTLLLAQGQEAGLRRDMDEMSTPGHTDVHAVHLAIYG